MTTPPLHAMEWSSEGAGSISEGVRDFVLEEKLRTSVGECRGLSVVLPAVCHCLGFQEDQEDSWKVLYDHLLEFLSENFKAIWLPHLRQLALSQIELAPDASGLLWECLHCYHLTELDLQGSHLNPLCDELQFWSVPNLRVLNLSETGLPWLPASVGRLKVLRVLSLNHNKLSTLPHTISFCSSLEELNLEDNNFSMLPGVILRIESLKTLRRHGNRFLLRAIADLISSGGRRHCYIGVGEEPLAAEEEGVGEVVPLRLLAVQTVMTSGMDYWRLENLAPAVCKSLDSAQVRYKICDQCCAAKPFREKAFRVRWLMESYLGLKHVPFEHFACSHGCADALARNFQKIQVRLMRMHEEAYRRLVSAAEREAGQSPRHHKFKVTETWDSDMHTHNDSASGERWHHMRSESGLWCSLL